jgi:hypothetical protein
MYAKVAPAPSSDTLAKDDFDEDSSVNNTTLVADAVCRMTRNAVLGAGRLFVRGFFQNEVSVPRHVPLKSRWTVGNRWANGSRQIHRSNTARTIVAASTAAEKNRSQAGFTVSPVDQMPIANTTTTTAATT